MEPADDHTCVEPFAVQDCALVAIATGKIAENLKELRECLLTVHPECIYYHFWGGLLRPRFDDPEYHNDFAIWSRYGLQDTVLAERLGIVDPTAFPELETLRMELIDIIEDRLDELPRVPWAKPDKRFYFVRSQTVVFDTHRRIARPAKLAEVIPAMSVGSIFLNFIDARRRTPGGIDDFTAWLSSCFEGYEALCDNLARVDPFFSGLTALRTRLSQVFGAYFGE